MQEYFETLWNLNYFLSSYVCVYECKYVVCMDCEVWVLGMTK